MTGIYRARHRRRRDIALRFVAVALLAVAVVWAVGFAVLAYALLWLTMGPPFAVLWAAAVMLLAPTALLGRWGQI